MHFLYQIHRLRDNECEGTSQFRSLVRSLVHIVRWQTTWRLYGEGGVAVSDVTYAHV